MTIKKIAIVVGEVSGDILGAALINAIKKRDSSIEFVGIGGPRMQALGFVSLFPMEALSVMGISEVIRHLPEILRIRRAIKKYILSNPTDLFIGIDAPDFNLGLELVLRKHGIPTLHYVSPSVWAWRQGRIKKIAKACSHMLTLFPFEADFYEKYQVPVSFVGHPLADKIPLNRQPSKEQSFLQLDKNKKIIAILPGSRQNEVSRLGGLFLQAARICLQKRQDLLFIIPCINQAVYDQLNAIYKNYLPAEKLYLVLGQSDQVLESCDVVLLSSGTATMEAMLYKKPMVVAYRLAAFSYLIAKFLVKTPFIAIPNLLANQRIIPELIQEQAKPDVLAEAVLAYLKPSSSHFALQDKFLQIHKVLQKNGSEIAADVVFNLLDNNND